MPDPISRWPTLVGCAVSLGAMLAAAPAGGAEPAHRAPAFATVVDCRKLSEPSARLACFDKTVADMDEAEAQGQLLVIDRAQAREVRRQAFGLSLPAFAIFNRGRKEEGVDKVTLEISGVAPTSSGRWKFATREGPVWEQIDDDPARNPHPGSKLEIERGMLGSFFCSVDGQRGVRCARNR